MNVSLRSFSRGSNSFSVFGTVLWRKFHFPLKPKTYAKYAACGSEVANEASEKKRKGGHNAKQEIRVKNKRE